MADLLKCYRIGRAQQIHATEPFVDLVYNKRIIGTFSNSAGARAFAEMNSYDLAECEIHAKGTYEEDPEESVELVHNGRVMGVFPSESRAQEYAHSKGWGTFSIFPEGTMM